MSMTGVKDKYEYVVMLRTDDCEINFDKSFSDLKGVLVFMVNYIKAEENLGKSEKNWLISKRYRDEERNVVEVKCYEIDASEEGLRREMEKLLSEFIYGENEVFSDVKEGIVRKVLNNAIESIEEGIFDILKLKSEDREFELYMRFINFIFYECLPPVFRGISGVNFDIIDYAIDSVRENSGEKLDYYLDVCDFYVMLKLSLCKNFKIEN